MWGKLGGAGLGFAIGGPIGALLGVLAGHVVFDSGLFADDKQLVFTTGLIALSAKMAKADGVVTRDEVAAFRQVVSIPEDEVVNVSRLFDLAQQTSAGFEAYAQQIGEHFRDEPALLEDVLDGLFHIAKADHAIHEAELRYVAEVARIFGFSGAEYGRIAARHVRLPDDPYFALGAERSWDDEQLKRHYRQLVAANHPDRQIALGLPPAAVKIATDRLAAINAAWETLRQERNIR
ncbi:molecular chaperone DjlA [Alsobacter metallidurans]|uniref:Molecular chaperone DjlA n=1 Tax=Alsobacter metallidurans TaxID=340221 RepID=A0A917I9Y7_9HYPH|nr:TerB family tellurite resistance protein [Alsobacter metallidurans]GGH27541.1 molecular chaperone DjlA [Alsobacter metallidurans]